MRSGFFGTIPLFMATTAAKFTLVFFDNFDKDEDEGHGKKVLESIFVCVPSKPTS